VPVAAESNDDYETATRTVTLRVKVRVKMPIYLTEFVWDADLIRAAKNCVVAKYLEKFTHRGGWFYLDCETSIDDDHIEVEGSEDFTCE
jgi:hypothetical protein